jgi:hypothetical protein
MGTTTSRRARCAGALAAVALVLTAAGCNGTQGGNQAETDAIRLGSGAETPSTATGASSSASASSAAVPTGPVEGKVESNKVRLEILSLRRGDGDLVTARFKLTNLESSGSIYSSTGIDDTYLLDAAGQKKYLAVTDSKNDCVCDSGLGSGLEPQESTEAYVTFPPLPAGVTNVSVHFPGFPPFEHVALVS